MSYIIYIAKFIGTLMLAFIYLYLIALCIGFLINSFDLVEEIGKYFVPMYLIPTPEGGFNVIHSNDYWIGLVPTLLIAIWLAFKTTKVPVFNFKNK